MTQDTPKTRLLGKTQLPAGHATRQAFEAHMLTEGYTASTIKNSGSALGSMMRLARSGRKLPPSFIPHAQRAARWILHEEGHLATSELGRWLERELPTDPLPAPDPKAREKVEALDSSTWKRLREAVLADDTLEALVLKVLMGTTLRIGGVLDQPIGALMHALVASDPPFAARVRKELGKLPPSLTLREKMSPIRGSRSPYVRVYNYVAHLSQQLGVRFSLNTIAHTEPGVRRGRRNV